MRTADIESLGFEMADYKYDVTMYNTYKKLGTEVKAKIFRYVKTEYDDNTGRINKLVYQLN